ncbi:hypothetical protein BFP70_13110 [Thioclava sp. SK-1]|uniref:LysR substrate-binding domain-containing protein n=1 Tax=Thioclava sp. SK-1 TaxID=1889770 RepID=UPI0008244B8E|nr:LysR substrate-binding domain-containing protein [Thioclava sp. SK-1]OCX63142.1 hypothetical protein BFP70_13110 [Thioclava sp. SK-1]
MNITLRQLTYLLSLEQHRNFSRAAEAVHVTQPALSMQIRELEQSLGLTLIERRPRDIRLTRAGRMVLEHARRIQAELKSLEAELRRGQGQINLGVIPTIAPYLMPRALPRLRELQSGLRLREARTEVLLEELMSGKLDAVVIATPAADMETRLLFEDRFLLAGTQQALAANYGLAPDALDPGDLLLLDEGHCLADQALALCGTTRATQSVDLGASSLATLCGLVGEGMGLTLVPELATLTETLAAPTMALARFNEEPSRQIRLVRRKDVADDSEWFAKVATILAEVGTALVEDVRRKVPKETRPTPALRVAE